MNTPTHMPSRSEACSPSCADSISERDDSELVIACTLGAGDLKQRVADIRDLARWSLRTSERQGLALRLTYDRDAMAEVEDVVAKESECCSFLTFDLDQDGQVVRLTITAPASAADAAGQLFAHFAPELARQAS